MIWLKGSMVHLLRLTLLRLLLFFPVPIIFAFAYPYFFPVPIHPSPPLSQFPSWYPPNHSLHCVHSQLLQFEFVLFLLLLCNYLNTRNSLPRSVMVMHRCRVPVHPPAGYRRHPHVHRGVSLWQRHRRPQAQCLRCHIHCAFRWVASWFLMFVQQVLTG